MEYRPPSETLPIFDSSVFRNRNASLTFDEARKYFLEFPRAQGPETLQTTTITGALTCSSTATFGTAGSADNIPTCISDYSTISSADSSSKIPTTAWVQTAITSGGGSVIGQYVQPATYIANPLDSVAHVIDIPVGTRYATFTIVGGGGAFGSNALDPSTGLMYPGGSGGSGSYCSASIFISDDAFVGFPQLQYIFLGGAQSTDGWKGALQWTPQAIALYGTSVTGQNAGTICNCSGGGGGGNAAIGAQGAAGVQGIIICASGNNNFSLQVSNGSAGKTTAPFIYSTANISVRGGQTPNADIRLDGNTISSWCDGASTNFVNNNAYLINRQYGGILLEFFT